MTVHGGAEGALSQGANESDGSEGQGEVRGLEARGGVKGSTGRGGADDWKAPGGSMQLSETTEGAKSLKGHSGNETEELDGFDIG